MEMTFDLYEHAAGAIRRIYDSRIDAPAILPMDRLFPEGRRFAEAWRDLRDEALAVAQGLGRVPRFHEIMPEQAEISANDGRDWRLLLLKAYGLEFPENMRLCPTLAGLLRATPEVLSASVSFLAPRKVIPEHRGPVRGVLRFYLPLVMPRDALGRPAAVLSVDGQDLRLDEGQALLWDDTFRHGVRNESDAVRIVLLMDVWRRGMPLDMQALSKLVVWTVRAGIRARRVVEAARRREG
jgi:aspartate beta-hydroxylase